jgi:hypothetical protein
MDGQGGGEVQGVADTHKKTCSFWALGTWAIEMVAESEDHAWVWVQEPILRIRNLQLQRKRCSRLKRFFKISRKNFVSKKHYLGYSWCCIVLQRWRCKLRS